MEGKTIKLPFPVLVTKFECLTLNVLEIMDLFVELMTIGFLIGNS